MPRLRLLQRRSQSMLGGPNLPIRGYLQDHHLLEETLKDANGEPYPGLNGSSGVHEMGWDWASIDKSKKEFTIPALTLFEGDTKRYPATISQRLSECLNWEQQLVKA